MFTELNIFLIKKNLPTTITVHDKRWSEMIRMYIKKIHAYRKQNLMELILFCRLILLLTTTLEIYMKRCQFMNSWICKNLIHLWKSTMQIIHYHCGGFFQSCVFISFLPSLEIMRWCIIRISLQYNIKKKYQNCYLKTARLYFYNLLCDFILHCYEQVTTEIFKRC